MFKIYNDRDRLWQWDVGQRLIVSDELSCSEVHFCNGTSDCSLVCEIYEEDGLRLVDVPNILLQSDNLLKVFAYVCNGEDQHTEHAEMFKVFKRTKPDDYVYTETEVKSYEALVKRVEALEKNGGGGGENPGVSFELDTTLTQAGFASDAKAVGDALEKKLNSDKLGDAVNDALRQAKESGEFDGDPGDDYVLTDADKSEIAQIAVDLLPKYNGEVEDV